MAVVAGVALTLGAQLSLPLLGKTLFESDFRAAYVDCALSEQHAEHFRLANLSPPLRTELGKTLAVERLRCLDYAQLRLRLRAFRVSDVQIALIESDAIAKTANLQCDLRCIDSLR
jgi:hypothetical protein